MGAGNGDVVGIGEVMVRLAAGPGTRLESARTLDVQVGGTECNVMVDLTALGRRCAWVSKLADNELGRLAYHRIAETGVDLSRVVWSKKDRAGVYFVELGMKPRPTKVLYDRRGSAASKLSPEDIDWDFIAGFRMVHLTGITPALSASCEKVVLEAVKRARSAGMEVSFDVNYRSKLWGPRRAFRCIEKVVRGGVDVLVVTSSDARSVFGMRGDPEAVLRKMAARYHSSTTVLTLGSQGAIASSGGDVYQSSGYEVEEIDRIGAGDAFDAAFLHGYMDGDLQKGLDLGVALSAIKHTVVGDFIMMSEEEISGIARSRNGSIRR
jgi:2-dehydro-3-deoxygluconokinase